jgi:AcrR family transcriptional regulator
MLDHTKLGLPEKQQEILKTALDLFQQFGIKRIPVEEICQSAGVSKMTFYKYFKNKTELVRFMWEKGFEQALEQFDKIRRMEIAFEDKLQLMLKLKDESTAKISHQFALDYFYATPDLKDFFEQLAGNSMKHFLDFIKEAQQKGEVRPDIKPQFLLAVINNIKLLVKDDQLINLYDSYHDFVMEVNNFIYYGILPKPGEKD